MKFNHEYNLLFILCIFNLKFYVVQSWDELCYTATWVNGYCVPYSQCAYVHRLASTFGLELPEHEKEKLLGSKCSNRTDMIFICCVPKDIIKERHHLQTRKVDNQHAVQQLNPLPTTTTFEKAKNSIPSTLMKFPSTLRTRFFDDDYDDDGDEFISSLDPRGLQLLSSTKCGTVIGKRIAYGEQVNKGDFPWMALLEYNSEKNKYKCSGTLITNRFVITAAHCIDNRYKLVGVIFGAHNTSNIGNCDKSDLDAYCPEFYGIERVIRHPQFNTRRFTNDIALIKLSRNVDFAYNIRPICLPISMESAQLKAQQDFIIAGWGLTEHDNSSQILLKAVVPLRELSLCETVFKQANYHSIRIGESHICAGGVDGKDACHGDSGGPLFFTAPYKNVNSFVQFGIVSFGFSVCGTDNPRPGVYTNITYFMPWITKSIY